MTITETAASSVRAWLRVPVLDARVLRRGVIAGATFGLVVSLGLTAQAALGCGEVCLDRAAADALVSAAIGIVTIGPLAAFARQAGTPVTDRSRIPPPEELFP
jgi:hypothetical protein